MDEFVRWVLPKSPIVFIPRFIKQESDLEYGEVVTHENYNEKLNLNGQQGDYNTEILRLLFTECEAERAIHIPYLDKIIEQKAYEHEHALFELNNRMSEFEIDLDNLDTKVETYYKELDERILDNDKDISDLQLAVTNIINGKTVVALAKNLEGVYSADAKHYYGTDKDKNIGFHRMPDSIYAHDLDEQYGAEIDGIIVVPRPNSVEEGMLTPELRDKINRESITNYPDLNLKPSINGIVLVGNLTLDDLDIQRKGNYLTEIPSSYEPAYQIRNWAWGQFYTKDEINGTYATITGLNLISEQARDYTDLWARNKNKTWFSEPTTTSEKQFLSKGDFLVVI